jgi:hypothetical protein
LFRTSKRSAPSSRSRPKLRRRHAAKSCAPHSSRATSPAQKTRHAARRSGGLDWAILSDLHEAEHAVPAYVANARRIAPWFPYRAEALLHAAPPNGRRTRRKWADDIYERWDLIRRDMDWLRLNGYTLTHRTLDEFATSAGVAI